jgi:quercetin dioxygenase-like cupin family protein
MFVKRLDDLRAAGAEKVLCAGKARTVRFLTAADGMGFTMSDVQLEPGMDQVMWYKNHWEANYVAAGTGTLEDTGTGRTWPLEAGVIYAVGPKDRHRIAARENMHIVSIFNPPLSGNEAHDSDGAYEPTGKVPPGRGAMFVKTLNELRRAGREKTVAGGSARTLRALLQEDGLGFTLADVNLAAGNRNTLWYKNHWEANYILDGEGEVSDLTTGEAWKMEPGMMYCVGPTDRHSMFAKTDLHLISIFCPALQGDEMHDAEGTLAPSGPIPPGPARKQGRKPSC